jgi:hypothetical protein
MVKLSGVAVIAFCGFFAYKMWQTRDIKPDDPNIETWQGAASNPVSPSGIKPHHVAAPGTIRPPSTPDPSYIPLQPLPPPPSTVDSGSDFGLGSNPATWAPVREALPFDSKVISWIARRKSPF